jgi:hypothetical protein
MWRKQKKYENHLALLLEGYHSKLQQTFREIRLAAINAANQSRFNESTASFIRSTTDYFTQTIDDIGQFFIRCFCQLFADMF